MMSGSTASTSPAPDPLLHEGPVQVSPFVIPAISALSVRTGGEERAARVLSDVSHQRAVKQAVRNVSFPECPSLRRPFRKYDFLLPCAMSCATGPQMRDCKDAHNARVKRRCVERRSIRSRGC